MTVASATSSISYTGNGVTQIFSVPFYFLDDTDLVVQKVNGDVVTLLVLNTDYTVSGAGDEDGGEITCLSAPVGGTSPDTLVISRVVALTQETALPANTPMPSSSLEQALDRAIMVCQQLQRAIAASIQLSTAAALTSVSGVLPNPEANTALGWNPSATGFANISLTDVGTGTYAPGFTGAVASRLVADKLRESVSVEDFGAAGDGVTDDSTAIQAAIRYLETLNGGVLNFAAKTYAIGSTLSINTNNIFLRGWGSYMVHDGGTGVAPGTKLLWIGSTGGTMVNFETPVGTGNAKRSGGGVEGVSLNGSTTAGIGYRVCSWSKLAIRECHVKDVTAAAYKFTCWSTTQLAEAADTQYCTLERVSWGLTSAAAVQSADGIVLTSEAPGTSTADTSLCRVTDCVGESYNGSGLHLIDADNNYISNCRGEVLGTGNTFLLEGTYSNVFVGCPIGDKVRMLGTASGAVRECTMNTFLGSDDSNSTGTPNADANCTYQWHGTRYGWQGLIAAPIVLAGSRPGADTERANLGSETLRVKNSAFNHMRLTDGTNEWCIRIDASGNLAPFRISGTGSQLVPGVYTATGDVAITGYLTLKDSAGTTRKVAVIT